MIEWQLLNLQWLPCWEQQLAPRALALLKLVLAVGQGGDEDLLH